MAVRRAPATRPRGPRRPATAGAVLAALLAVLWLLVPAAAAGPGDAPPPTAATGDRDPGPHATAAHAEGPYAPCAAPARAWRDAPGERHAPPPGAAVAPGRTGLTGPAYAATRPAPDRQARPTAHAAPCRGRAPPSSTGI
ncbi:hypothetical protein ACFZAU_03315 [Streptomyces sp. NPDC008238]